ADGLTEWLERVVAEAGSPLGDVQTLHLHATDTGDDWLLRGGAQLTLSRERADATGSVSGPATELFLAGVRRRTADEAGLTITGDESVWQTWLDCTPF